MNVIQIMDNFSVGGGVNSFVYDLCYALKEKGCEVSLIGILNKGYDGNSEVEKLRRNGIRVECLGASSKKNAIFYYIKSLRNLIIEISKGEKAVCNLHLKLSVLMGGISTIGLLNVNCVETYHSLYSHYWLEYKLLSPCIDKYIACSDSAKQEFIERFHPKIRKIVAIPNGVNRDMLRSQITEVKESDTISIVSVGRFTDQKNLHVTAAAFSTIENENFQYKIFGGGELKQKILDAANNSSKVKLCGSVSRQRIINELANASLVVMPSLWEGLSIFMLEALALDCPMMISDEPSMRNVFKEGPLNEGEEWRKCEWGYLVSTNNVEAYRQAMIHFLTHRENYEAMKNSICKYSKCYDIVNTARNYIDEYQKILKGKSD